MLEHTPGPWVYEGLDYVKTDDYLRQPDEGKRLYVKIEEGTADDAKLIAAAPDLYHACKNLLGVYRLGNDYVEAVMQVSRAVAKAEGR
jgi:hypothetical protein